jgi:hypothetical protein
MLTIILVVVVVLLLLGGVGTWGTGYRTTHGPAAGGVIGLLLLLVVIWLILRLAGVLV